MRNRIAEESFGGSNKSTIFRICSIFRIYEVLILTIEPNKVRLAVLVAHNLAETSCPGIFKLGIVVKTIGFVLMVGIVRRRIC